MWEARPAAMFLMFSIYRLSAFKGEQQLSPLKIHFCINSRLSLPAVPCVSQLLKHGPKLPVYHIKKAQTTIHVTLSPLRYSAASKGEDLCHSGECISLILKRALPLFFGKFYVGGATRGDFLLRGFQPFNPITHYFLYAWSEN